LKNGGDFDDIVQGIPTSVGDGLSRLPIETGKYA
jgi:hypothetical protein